MNFALILEATTNAIGVTSAHLAEIAAAVTLQLNRDVAVYWGGDVAHCVRVSDGTDLQAGEVAFALVDVLPDAPGAIAYHDVNGQGVPAAFEALSLCNSVLTGSDSVSVAISHECIESIGDPACNAWRDDGKGNEWCQEIADAVESTTYNITTPDGTTVAVSDFLLPSFFDPGAAAPYSFRGSPSLPFATSTGGYQIRRSSGTGETQVTAHGAPGLAFGVLTNGAQRRHSVKRGHWSSRAYRRGVRA